MSTEVITTPADEEKPHLTEKENKLLVAAMMSLKSGVPDLDYQRFQKNANFNTLKTAQNTWATLRKKIIALNPEAAEAAKLAKEAPTTPKSTSKKRTKKESDVEETAKSGVATPEEGSPKKKARTSGKKKTDAGFSTITNAAAGETTEGSPMKKKAFRKILSKKPDAKKSEEKAEPAAPVEAITATAEPTESNIGAEEKSGAGTDATAEVKEEEAENVKVEASEVDE